MDIQFLGTGAGQPSKARNVSSLALKLLDEINEVWLFDCGEATQNQILETTIRPRKVSKIFITHLHGDHIFGLPGFLSSRAFQANEEQTDLDIYGPVDPGEDESWFAELRKSFTDAITYIGNAPFDKSVEILSGYFALLFPTQYFTEGIPGTIIDAYAAGVPVIASKWKSFADVVEEGITGLGYDFNTTTDLEKIMEKIITDPSIITNLKKGCVRKANDFLPQNAIKPLIDRIK